MASTEPSIALLDGDELPDELSTADALLLGTRLHRLGSLDDAQRVYRAVLQAEPEHPDALQFLGILHFQQGHRPDGMALLQRSLRAAPHAPGPHINLGNMLLEEGRIDEAAASFERASTLGPPSAELMNNIGVMHRHQGRLAEAEQAYRSALAIDPEFIDGLNNLAHALALQGRGEEAVRCYCEAIALSPKNPRTRRMLGIAYGVIGRKDDAIAIYRDWLHDEPDNPLPRHYLAACTGQGIPDRAPDDYVQRTFDTFAESFDAKLQQLDYRAPQLVAQAVAAACGEPRAALDVLDAGCGTGLCGPLLAPFARRLVGVDLAAGMLAKAGPRGVYQALEQAELGAYLAAQHRAFDLIVSADTLCYFGALEGVMQAAAGALRAGGQLVFSVEALAAEPGGSAPPSAEHSLHPHGRYSHSLGYLQRVVPAAGFEAAGIEAAVLRREGGRPVNGYIVTARLAAAGH